MLFDHLGRQLTQGQTVQEFTFNVGADTALPNWLAAIGSSLITFQDPSAASALGRQSSCVIAQHAATPAVNDIAGIKTAFNILSSQYSEVGFYVMGFTNDGSSQSGNVAIQLQYSSDVAANGVLLQTNPLGSPAGLSQTKISAQGIQSPAYQFGDTTNILRVKSFGVTIHPRTKEVYWTTGDPADGAGVFGYSRGQFVDANAPINLQIVTKNTSQRAFSVKKIKLRLCNF